MAKHQDLLCGQSALDAIGIVTKIVPRFRDIVGGAGLWNYRDDGRRLRNSQCKVLRVEGRQVFLCGRLDTVGMKEYEAPGKTY